MAIKSCMKMKYSKPAPISVDQIKSRVDTTHRFSDLMPLRSPHLRSMTISVQKGRCLGFCLLQSIEAAGWNRLEQLIHPS